MIGKDTNIVTQRIGPLWEKTQYRDTKDPCPVFDGKLWHIFGSGGDMGGVKFEEWEILHATAKNLTGPWTELPSVKLIGLKGKHVAAPGVVYENGLFLMFVQTEFLAPGGTIEYLVSKDGGNSFKHVDTALRSLEGTHEGALYDPHPAIINGQKYLTYCGSEFIGQKEMLTGLEWIGEPDIYLARSESNTWAGPWKREGKILDHQDVIHHNQREALVYEWGLEGPQLIELPNGIIIMNVVCFLPYGVYGTRQRVFFAFADNVHGPYYSAGTVLQPIEGSWEAGENGHAAAFMRGPDMILFYQGRPPGQAPWRYGIAYFNIRMLERIGKLTIRYHAALNQTTKAQGSNELTELRNKWARSRVLLSLTAYTRELRAAMRKYRAKTRRGQ